MKKLFGIKLRPGKRNVMGTESGEGGRSKGERKGKIKGQG